MILVFQRRRAAILYTLMMLPFTLSCGRESYVPAGHDAEQIRQLAVAYMRYIGSHNGRPPGSEDQFRKYLSSLGHDDAKIDEMLVSPRDGKPYEIVYNAPITGSRAVVVAYERTGVNGERYIAFDFGGVEIADPDRFAKLVESAE